MKKKYKKNNEIKNKIKRFYEKIYVDKRKNYDIKKLLKRIYNYILENNKKIIDVYGVNNYFISNILYNLEHQLIYKLKENLEEIINK